MSCKRKVKTANNENQCPSEIKRLKLSSIWKFKENTTDKLKEDKFQQIGIDMLESDESSCSGAIGSCNSNNNSSSIEFSDENSNEQTPSVSAPVRIHPSYDCNIDYLNETAESELNKSFVDPNETIKQKPAKASLDLYSDIKCISNKGNKNARSNSKGRSPLATVVCNNNYTNISQKITSNSVTSTVVLDTSLPCSSAIAPTEALLDQQHVTSTGSIKKTFIPDENFFLYRNRERPNFQYKDNFKKLSDEMILQIFKWLPKKALARCSYVCSRFNQLAQDESLWTRLDLGNKTLRSGALGQVISRGVVILRLAQADIAQPIFHPEKNDFYADFQSKLQYLDLSMAVITKSSLIALLSKCRNLKKLSLEHVPLNDSVCDEISKNVHLEALNLAMSSGIEQWSVLKLMKSLPELHSLNISWTFLKIESITAIVQNLTPNILRLNIAGCRKNMFDSHVSVLSKRCPGLLELDLSDCTGLSASSVTTVCAFKDLEYLSLSRCYGIPTGSYVELKNLKSLGYLDVFGILSETALQTLKNTFPSLGINKFIHSSVARPTVGTRRTSIWGLRTRD